MIGAVTGGIGSIKNALEVVKGINATITESKVAEAKTQIVGHLIAAQQAMLDAQQTLLEDTDTIRALEAEVMRLKDWQAEAKNYELADTGSGALAYRLKDSVESAEPPHWLCPTCFPSLKKSIMQPETIPEGRVHILRCNTCKTILALRGSIPSGWKGR